MKLLWKESCAILLFMFLLPSIAFAGSTRTQIFNLKSGWNAVFLEIEPADSRPDTIFINTPVIQLLTFYPKHSSISFIKDPDEIPWNKAGWNCWVQPDRPEAVLTNLYGLQAGQAYLIFCTEDFTWELTGEVKFTKRSWQPQSYNFTGFYVDPFGPPTFLQYFAGSQSALKVKIFKLINNKWKQVLEPWIETIESGKAYWIWYEDELDYPGPMEIKIIGVENEILFLPEITELELNIINRSPDPLSFILKQVESVDNQTQIPLSLVKYNLTANKIKTYENLQTYEPTTPINPGENHTLRLAIRQNDMNEDIIRSLLMITDDIGDRFYLPIQAEKVQVK
ncbi:conserved hypothetical protein, secreted [Candidatus Magnetomorum sp. HK-1]|nr:conserved hypothetical protein, secreted [Candidatus Magnetomorum sp. HK-1]